MKIFIPSRGRTATQTTWDFMGPKTRAITNIICPPDEVEIHRALGRNAVPRPVNGLSKVIQHIWDTCEDRHVIVCDDDLKFAHWADPKSSKLAPCKPEEVDDCFDILKELLGQGFPLVGISQRTYNDNNFPLKFKDCTRQMQVHGYDLDFMKKHGIRADAVEIRQDMFITLSVLQAGRFNRIITNYCIDQKGGSNAVGGVSLYRNAEMMEKNAKQLEEMFPGIVHAVQKKSNNWKGVDGGFRWDVDVEWKAAYKGAQSPEY